MQQRSDKVEFKSYRITLPTSQSRQLSSKQPTLKVLVQNSSDPAPRIRKNVLCNGKNYPLFPIFPLNSEQDLAILEQVSVITLKENNQFLCQIISGRVKEVKVSQFKELKSKVSSVFSLDLKIDLEELFLILVADQISDDWEFNQTFDLLSQTEFFYLIKNLYQNCPSKTLPKILRKLARYFNSTLGRELQSLERLKRIFKILKSTDECQTKNDSPTLSMQKLDQEQKNEPEAISLKSIQKKQNPSRSYTQKKPQSQTQLERQTQEKQLSDIFEEKSPSNKIKKITNAEKGKTPTTKTKVIKVLSGSIQPKQRQGKKVEHRQKDSDWNDIDEQNEAEQEEKQYQSLQKMADENGSDDDLKYISPKKKNKKPKGSTTIPLDPQFDRRQSKRQAIKKEKKNRNQNFMKQVQNDQNNEADDDKNARKSRKRNAGDSQSLQRSNRQFSKENRRIDPRIVLGINGATDVVWREKMRPPKIPSKHIQQKNEQNTKIQLNNQIKEFWFKSPQTTSQANGQFINISAKSTTQVTKVQNDSNVQLKKVFSFPGDGRSFKFQKRNYNLFVNKLFWVNITEGQVSIQKEGKGYIRKCQVEVIDEGKKLMAEGLTIDIEKNGISNLEDGGDTFGHPQFEEFAPNGQWFPITSLDVYAYV